MKKLSAVMLFLLLTNLQPVGFTDVCKAGFTIVCKAGLYAEDRTNIVERSDFRVYENNRYIGLTSRESFTYIRTDKSGQYSGETFVLEQTKHNGRQVVKKLDRIFPFAFFIEHNTDETDPREFIHFSKDAGYPLLRNIPVIPKKKFSAEDIGLVWEQQGIITVRPKKEKPSTRVPVYVLYSYRGQGHYRGKKVDIVDAHYAVRYQGDDANGDKDLLRSEGSHTGEMFLIDGLPVLIRENIDRTFFYSDGMSLRHRGFLLHFYSRTNTSNKELPEKKQDTLFTTHKTDRGTMIRIDSIRFYPDSAELLPTEDAALKNIARVLQTSQAKRFFVEGHTAKVGSTESQVLLSEKRAHTIVEKLRALGLADQEFIYAGAGGTKPVAPNDTEEGRAKNRRVEITILE